MLRERVISQNLRDFLDLWRQFTDAKARGEDLTQWRQTITAGLKALFPPLPDTDWRLAKKCWTCEDTGYEFVTKYPDIYGGKTPIRVARPCGCERGRQMRRSIDGAAERAAERRVPPRRTTWAKVG